MSVWDDLRGQTKVLEWFQRAVARNRLSHSYLFAGPSGVGKKWFARKLAQSLLCNSTSDSELDACGRCPNCKRFLAETHPDVHEVGLPEGKREIPIDLIVGDRDHRGRAGLCYEMSLRPMAGDRKVALIDDAHLMNRESANSLLKTLEEPPARSLMILISDREENLLPTIRSRCQTVRFSPLSEADVSEILIQQELVTDPTAAQNAAALSEGSLDQAMTVLEGPLRDLSNAVRQGLSANDWNPLSLHSLFMEMIEDAGDASAQREVSFWLLRFLGEEFRRRARESSASPESTRFWNGALSQVRESEKQLEESMSISLCLQALFDSLSRWNRSFAKA